MSRQPPGKPPAYLRAALRHLRAGGGAMPALIARHGAPTMRRTRNSFESLGRAIVYQQLSGSAAGTIYRRFLALYSTGRFPTPPALLATADDALRGAGLSRAKAASLRDLALAYTDGRVRPRRFRHGSNDEIRDMLIQVRGIGPWSVDMFLMFGLNRPDVLPVGDLGIKKGMQAYFATRGLPSEQRMQRLAEPWRPYRTVASWYLWRVADGGLP